MFGYKGKLLRVDLTEGSLEERPTSEQLARAFLGGRGLGAALLYKELERGVDPLSPKNVLIFMTGPAVGTPLPACPRWEVVTKSPLTSMYCCGSVGGFFGAELKFAGYDGIIVRGKAANPTYLAIIDGRAELRDAGKLWGMNTDEVEAALRKELKDSRARVASIGPAGENLVKIASIQADLRSAGRGGPGAVMGSKLLKAIAVRGHERIEVADEDGLMALTRELVSSMKESRAVQNFSRWGTPQFVDPVNEGGLWPTRNFREGSFEGARRLNAESMRERLVKRDTACYACPIACGKLSVVGDGPYAGVVVEGPDYETLWAFGAQCGVDRLDAIAAANLWCDRYGIDTISAGNAIGFAMECFEHGLLTSSDTGGLDLKFGNHEVFVELLRRIAFREGIGDLLAEGVRAAAERMGRGAEKFAMHVKGLELPAYDPRGAWGMALAYATACRGGCHLKAWTLAAEVFEARYDRFSSEGKAKLVFDLQNIRAAVDSIGVCVIGSRAMGVREMARVMTVTTGWSFKADDITKAGERIYNLERLLAVRDGISREDDTLPPRLLNETLPHGPCKGIALRGEDLDRMLDEYYALRGWDRRGRPKKDKIEELGITKLLG
ncbi:MAG: aldehyde ferredoxin oxidoreductase family protein [Candidatus Hodarchaeaceae archaeon]|nr:aldehyde ferredoxin oxidoreductase family protein [Candidatus Hodarchaeaceae archaeon]